MKSRRMLSLSALAVAGLFAGNVCATTWDAAADFSSVGNPAGPWSYGTTGLSSTGPLTLFDRLIDVGGLMYWDEAAGQGLPLVGKVGAADWNGWNTVSAPANSMIFHPGLGGQFPVYAAVRFVAPAAGTYQVSASFWGDDFWPTTTDVHIFADSTEAFSDTVHGFGLSSAKSWTGTLNLAQHSTLLFSVGDGGNSYGNDSTGFSASIVLVNSVPEPSAVLLLAVGLGLVGAIARRGGAATSR